MFVLPLAIEWALNYKPTVAVVLCSQCNNSTDCGHGRVSLLLHTTWSATINRFSTVFMPVIRYYFTFLCIAISLHNHWLQESKLSPRFHGIQKHVH